MDRKTELLDTAENLVRRRGFQGMSFADVAQEIGIKTASIHYHFPGKAALGAALMERYAEVFAAKLEELAQSGVTPAAQLAGLVAQYRAALQGGETMCLCVALSINRDTLAEPIIREMTAFRQMVLGWLTELYAQSEVNADISSDARAAATLALLEGAQLIAHTQKDMACFDLATAGLFMQPV